MNQEPVVKAGTKIMLSDHPVTVVRIVRTGVVCQVGSRTDREYEIPFEAIEEAVK
jgi:hypothetical protein